MGYISPKKATLIRIEDAIIKMPSGVFKPYAGVSTAVLFFTKGEPTERAWFYGMENDGFSLDDKRTPTDKNDIPDVIERFKKRKEEPNNDRKKKHFFVSLKEIKEKEFDLTFNKYKEDVYEEKDYGNPNKYLDKFESLENEILEGAKELREMVNKQKTN